MQGLLGAQIHADTAALRGRKATGDALHVSERHVSTGGVVRYWHGKQFSLDLLKTRAVSINERLVVQALANDDGQHGQEQEGIGARSQLQVNIRLIGRLSPARINDHHGAVGVVLDVAQHIAGIDDAV